MRSIRLLLANAPHWLGEATRAALIDRGEVAVIGEAQGEMDTLLQAGEDRATVVLLGMSGPTLPALAERLLDEYPRIGVVAVDIDSEPGWLYQLRPQLEPVGAFSGDRLISAIRRVAG